MKKLNTIIAITFAIGIAGVPATYAQAPVIYSTAGSHVYTVPTGITSIIVECWGGGGKGGTRTTDGEGGGGGGGAYSRSLLTVSPTATYNIEVGGGSTSTAAGGSSSFETISEILVLARGGQSVANNSALGAEGGLASTGIGLVKFNGGNGANAIDGNTGGGGSSAGPAANGNPGIGNLGGAAPTNGGAGGNGGASNSTAGLPGASPGGGGGGGDRLGTGGVGGNGGTGRVVITPSVCDPPVFASCPTNIIVLASPGLCSAMVNYAATASAVITPTISYVFTGATAASGSGTGSGTIFNTGITQVTITASNGCVPNAVCSFTITVRDTEAPVIVCMPNLTRPTDPGQLSAIVSIIPPNASDNCSVASIVGVRSDLLSFGNPFPMGVTTITWTATDTHGNTAICRQTVTIVDNEPPLAICKNITIALSAAGLATIVPGDIDGGSTDNSGILSLHASKTSFTCADIGANYVILTVTDLFNNPATCTATVTVTDPNAPNLRINNVTVSESDGSAVFTITMSSIRSCNVTFLVSTQNNTAIAGLDYIGLLGTYTIFGGSLTTTVSVTIINNSVFEPTETFFVNISNPMGAVILVGQGICTILDDDAPLITMADLSVTEGAPAVFAATLTNATPGGVTLTYSTLNGTATAPQDYTTVTGTLNFIGTAGEVRTVTVTTIDDNLVEPEEHFFLTFNHPSNPVGIQALQAKATLIDNDQATISVNDISVSEGVGTATFVVTLSKAVQNEITITYATVNNTAIAPGDYTPVSGTLTFGGTHPLTKQVAVTIIDDAIIETPETFYLNLTGLSAAGQTVTVTKSQGICTINDNDLIIKPGDANCDEVVNVLDVVSIVNYILGNTPPVFCFNNADVNNDQTINVLDLVGTINIILAN